MYYYLVSYCINYGGLAVMCRFPSNKIESTVLDFEKEITYVDFESVQNRVVELVKKNDEKQIAESVTIIAFSKFADKA